MDDKVGMEYELALKEYPDVLNVKQISEILAISTKTIYKLIQDKTIPSLKIGREYRFLKVELLKCFATRRFE